MINEDIPVDTSQPIRPKITRRHTSNRNRFWVATYLYSVQIAKKRTKIWFEGKGKIYCITTPTPRFKYISGETSYIVFTVTHDEWDKPVQYQKATIYLAPTP